MKKILNIGGKNYYLLSEFIELHQSHRNIYQRKEMAKRVFTFWGNSYIDAETWVELERLIEIDKEYYYPTNIEDKYGYNIANFENRVLKIFEMMGATETDGYTTYYKRDVVDRYNNASELYSDYFKTNVVCGFDLVRYHNSEENRLYHKGNLLISAYHLQFIYPKEKQVYLNNELCILIDTKDIFGDFRNRCKNSTADDYFLNYFGKDITYKDTYDIIHEFYIKTVNDSKSLDRDILSTELVLLFWYLYSQLSKELFDYNANEIKELIFDDPRLSNKKVITHFLNYAKMKNPSFLPEIKQYRQKAVNKRTDYEGIILPAEEFADIYSAAIDTNRHVEAAYNDYAYAQYWLYVLLLLSNFSRACDIKDLSILELPMTYEWGALCNDEISRADAEIICNIYETKAKNELIHKSLTQKKLYFLEEQKPAVATAIVICIGHAKRNNIKKVFSSKRSYSAKRIYEKLGEPFGEIGNRKMNYTLATFFEGTGTNADNYRNDVYSLLTVMRSHVIRTPLDRSNTTLIYIKHFNHDLAVSRMSYHTFQRGSFGWLYHVMLVMAGESFKDHEEETKRIKELMDFYKPDDLENVSAFIEEEDKERAEILKYLQTLGKESIRVFLGRLGTNGTFKTKSDLPCIFGRNCPRTGVKCLYCEFSIKTIHSVHTYKNELEVILDTLENSNDKWILKKGMYLLYKVLRVFQELRKEYSAEYVAAFIDMNEVKTRMMNLPASTLSLLDRRGEDGV